MAGRSHLLYISIFLLCFGLSLKGFGLYADSSNDNEIPSIVKVGFSKTVGPTVKFLYCYSCGYRKVFDDYVNIIQQKYPGITVLGANYDPPGMSLQIARLLSIGKMLIIFAIMSGMNPFQYLGAGGPPPSWWSWCTENKVYACLMCFFLTNAIEGQLMSTGAFEIMLDDMPVWSKLETGRIPQPSELFQIIENHLGLQFESKLDLNTGFNK